MTNLLEDAAAHCPPDQPIEVVVSGKDDERLRLTVRNRGPVVPADLLPHVFEPFRRDGKRPGRGLGLYIVMEVAKSHGGGVTMTSDENGGTVVEMTLPRREDSPGEHA
jgi:signal transduction histidine kinase